MAYLTVPLRIQRVTAFFCYSLPVLDTLPLECDQIKRLHENDAGDGRVVKKTLYLAPEMALYNEETVRLKRPGVIAGRCLMGNAGPTQNTMSQPARPTKLTIGAAREPQYGGDRGR